MSTAPVTRPPSQGIWIPDTDTAALLDRPVMRRPPVKLMLSLVDKCNLRCFHCLGSSTTDLSKMTGRAASPELIAFITDQIVPNVRAVRLGGLGETEQLIAPGFDDFIDRMAARAPLEYFQLTTNLSVMTPERADRLARILTDIEVSIEGIGKNFEWARKMPWSRLTRNLEMVVEAKRRNAASRMRITLLACVIPRHFDDLLRLDLFRSLGVERVVLRELDPVAPEHCEHLLSHRPLETEAFLREFRTRAVQHGIEYGTSFDGKYDSLTTSPIGRLGRRDGTQRGYERCCLPFETLTLTPEGRFGVCCLIQDLVQHPAAPVGVDIMTVWNAPAFVSLRARVNSDSPGDPCRTCSMKSRAAPARPVPLSRSLIGGIPASLRTRLASFNADVVSALRSTGLLTWAGRIGRRLRRPRRNATPAP